MFSLTGKTALVTGASGGIGSDIARALHKQGATVTLSGTRREALETLQKELGDRAHVATCNLADGAQVDEARARKIGAGDLAAEKHRARQIGVAEAREHPAERRIERRIESDQFCVKPCRAAPDCADVRRKERHAM